MQEIVLKILSGPMFGVDIALPDENVHLFFCDSDAIAQSHTGSVYQYAINTLLIPCAKGDNEKFLLRFTTLAVEDQEERAVNVTAQRIPLDKREAVAEENPQDEKQEDDPHADVFTLPMNKPSAIGHAVIALKHAGETWSQDVSDYGYPNNTSENNGSSPDAAAPTPERKRISLFKCFIVGLLCLAAGIMLFSLFMPNNVGTLKDELSPVHPDISQTQNGEIYVLTKTQPEVVWSEHALRKSNLAAKNIRILAENVERARMKALLSEHIIPFFDVKYTSAFTVTLLLSQERSAGDPGIEKSVRDLLLKNFSYLTTIHIQRISDGVVLANAAARLKSLGLYSQKDIAENHVTFSISGEVDDFQLGTLRRQVNEFYDQYGDEYVKFVVNLNEDPLRNRTFKTGPDSYVVIPGNHWLYSDINNVR